MIYSNGSWYLAHAKRVIQECELIIKFPTRTMEVSPLKNFSKILQKGQCDDFSKECIDIEETKVSNSFNVLGPIRFFALEKAIAKRMERKVARDLYDRGRVAKNQIEELLKTEKAQDRYSLLKLAYLLLDCIVSELKDKLIK